MKKLLYVLGLGVVMAGCITTSVQAKVGVVNVTEIFQKMPERDRVSKKLEAEFKGRITELQTMEKALQTSLQNLQSKGQSMKAADRTKLEKDIMASREQFATKAQAFEKDNERRQAEERNKILAKIQKAVEGIAKQEKYTVIVDANAIAFAEPSTDITAKVLSKVQ